MLGNLEDECTHYCMSRDDAKKSLTQLSTVHRKKLKDFEELQEVLKVYFHLFQPLFDL